MLGDRKYRLAKNYNNKGTLMLHAYKIKFSIAGKKYSFTAELPLLFRKTINEKYLKTSL